MIPASAKPGQDRVHGLAGEKAITTSGEHRLNLNPMCLKSASKRNNFRQSQRIPHLRESGGIVNINRRCDGNVVAALAVGTAILCGLRKQVGAIYRNHGPGRNSSRRMDIGPREKWPDAPGSYRLLT